MKILMKNSGLPLYLKISPIYNKILQLGIAVLCIAVLLNILVFSQNKQDKVIEQKFSQFSQIQLKQAVTALIVLLNKADDINKDNKAAIETFITDLAQSSVINDIHFYNELGELQASSSNSVTIKTLYGLSSSDAINQSKQYGTFVEEVRTDKLIGYLRFTIDKPLITDELFQANFDVHEIMRLLILFSVVIGFLLTRGFSRFSRQGFRVKK